MPLPQPPHGVIRIRLLHNTQGKEWGIGFWVNMGTGADPTSGNLDTFADAIRAVWGDAIEDDCSPATILIETTAEWHSGAGTSITGVSTTTATGTVGGNPLPLSCCHVLSWGIPENYRGGKPRSYVSGGTDADLSGSALVFSAGSASAWTAHGQDLLAGVNALTVAGQACVMGTLSYFENDVERGGTPPPVIRTVPKFEAYLSCISHTRPGTQRRRIQA